MVHADLTGLLRHISFGSHQVAVVQQLGAAVVEPVLPADAIPQAQGLIIAAGDNPIPLGAKGHGQNRAAMALEGLTDGVALAIPQAQGLIMPETIRSPSGLPETIRSPSGLKATAQTESLRGSPMGLPSRSHRRRV